MKNKTMTKKQIQDALDKEYDRWNHLRIHGGSDPFHSDGVNMNLVRNHIIYFMNCLADLERNDVDTQMSLFEIETESVSEKQLPPLVDNNYMANAEDIRAKCISLLDRLSTDPCMQFVLAQSDDDFKKNSSWQWLKKLPDYVSYAIEKDDLVEQRRYAFDNGNCSIKRLRENLCNVMVTSSGRTCSAPPFFSHEIIDKLKRCTTKEEVQFLFGEIASGKPFENVSDHCKKKGA